MGLFLRSYEDIFKKDLCTLSILQTDITGIKTGNYLEIVREKIYLLKRDKITVWVDAISQELGSGTNAFAPLRLCAL